MTPKANWNTSYAEGKDYQVMSLLLLGDILRAAGVPQQASVLDVGCGTGDLAVKLALRGHRVTGVDLSTVAVEKANERSAEAGTSEQTAFRVADIEDPDQAAQFDGQRFDLVTCKLVVAFIHELPSFFAWARQHLAPKGSLVIVTPVLHEGYEYSPRMRNISVDRKKFTDELAASFSRVDELKSDYFDELGDRRTFIVR